MGKKIITVLGGLLCIATMIGAQESERIVTPFSDSGGMTGLVLEATGYGLVIGGGVASSSRSTLSLGLTFMAIAPLASTSGAWLFQNYMERTTNFWVNNGVNYNGSQYLKTSKIYAYVTTGAALAAVLSGLFMQNTTGVIISLVCSGVSVGSDIIALYSVRRSWMESLNKAIITSGVDWRTILASKPE